MSAIGRRSGPGAERSSDAAAEHGSGAVKSAPEGVERPSEGPGCASGVCVTCSDTAVPARVVALLDGGLALADAGAGAEEIGVALVDARPGDTVLVHAGEAIAVVRDTGRETPAGREGRW